MLISRHKKFIFIHIYKTAGTSVARALRSYAASPFRYLFCRGLNRCHLSGCLPPGFDPEGLRGEPGGWGHMTAQQVCDWLGEDEYKSYYSFSVVRNPWDWQVSLYRFALQTPGHHQYELIHSLGSFEKYIEWRCCRERKLQSDFICDRSGSLLVDDIIYFESIDDGFSRICRTLGVNAMLPKLNVSNREGKSYRDYYSAHSRKMVAKYFEKDIDMFGYSF